MVTEVADLISLSGTCSRFKKLAQSKVQHMQRVQPPSADTLTASRSSSRCALDVPIEIIPTGGSTPGSSSTIPSIPGPQVIPQGATSPPCSGPPCRFSTLTPPMNGVVPKLATAVHNPRFQRVWTVAKGPCVATSVVRPPERRVQRSPQRSMSPHAHGLRLGSQTPPRSIPVAPGALPQTGSWMPCARSADNSRSLSPHYRRLNSAEVQHVLSNPLSRSMQTWR